MSLAVTSCFYLILGKSYDFLEYVAILYREVESQVIKGEGIRKSGCFLLL